MIYHVSIDGNNEAPGTISEPFKTISQAAKIAVAGDEIIVHSGIYREWVNPKNGGTEEQRITYKAAGDGEVVITGAELIKEWNHKGDSVWCAEVPNAMFGGRNPFEIELRGDWIFEGPFTVHLGDVYLDNKSLYECESIDMVYQAAIWPDAKYPEDSKLKWFAQVESETTKIWANFGDKDPREENVEISVRPYCFWPEQSGLNYITVDGFTLRQASPQWAPPTDFQEGLIGPHWSKGWIIKNNHISESKCVGISLGTKKGTGHEKIKGNHTKGGTQREQEVIFKALEDGWHKDTIGGHSIHNNVIHDCEQAAIVGHMGCAFSHISNNRIYNIHHKRLRHGAEVAGIKFHAALDTQIDNNTIYSCYRAIWLDWQAQGTRINGNVLFDNLSEDLFVEVCHGPYLVDHNLFLSPMNFRNMAQGGAFVHNLFAGRFVVQSETTRTTPYHFPHKTAIAGYSNITSGDDRYYNNVFIGDGNLTEGPVPITFFEHLPLKPRDTVDKDGRKVMDGVPDDSICMLYPVGLGSYNSHPSQNDKQWWAYTKEELAELGDKVQEILVGNAVLPVAMDGNLYLNNSQPSLHEESGQVLKVKGISVSVDTLKGKVKIHIESPDLLNEKVSPMVSTDLLGKTYHANMNYENEDGMPYCFDLDFFGEQRSDVKIVPGPFIIHGKETYVFE